MVDVGDVDSVFSMLPEDACVRGVFLTHSHFDHLYGINDLVSKCPQCVVYTSAHGKEGLYSEKLNLSRYHESPIVFKGEHVCVLGEGSSVELFPGVSLRAIETPGHDWSCLSYLVSDPVASLLFTGDSLIPNVAVVTSLPHGDKTQSQASVSRLKNDFIPSSALLCPGHGQMQVLAPSLASLES